MVRTLVAGSIASSQKPKAKPRPTKLALAKKSARKPGDRK
jgi:hypothetical protein